VLPQGLKVKEVEAEDAGVYVCKATNGFGSLSVNYTLIVMGQLVFGSEVMVGSELLGHGICGKATCTSGGWLHLHGACISRP
jgi:hypothetical protein